MGHGKQQTIRIGRICRSLPWAQSLSLRVDSETPHGHLALCRRPPTRTTPAASPSSPHTMLSPGPPGPLEDSESLHEFDLFPPGDLHQNFVEIHAGARSSRPPSREESILSVGLCSRTNPPPPAAARPRSISSAIAIIAGSWSVLNTTSLGTTPTSVIKATTRLAM